jgi:hypothetical protein
MRRTGSQGRTAPVDQATLDFLEESFPGWPRAVLANMLRVSPTEALGFNFAQQGGKTCWWGPWCFCAGKWAGCGENRGSDPSEGWSSACRGSQVSS